MRYFKIKPNTKQWFLFNEIFNDKSILRDNAIAALRLRIDLDLHINLKSCISEFYIIQTSDNIDYFIIAYDNNLIWKENWFDEI